MGGRASPTHLEDKAVPDGEARGRVDGEVPEGQGDGGIDGAQRVLEDVGELHVLGDEPQALVDVVARLPGRVVEVEFEEVVGALVAVTEFGGTGGVIHLPQHLIGRMKSDQQTTQNIRVVKIDNMD